MKYRLAHRVPMILTCQTDTCASEQLRRHSFKKNSQPLLHPLLLPPPLSLCCSPCSSGVPWRKPWCDLVQTIVDSG